MMKKIILILIITITLFSCSEKNPETGSASVSEAMGSADTTGFEKAINERVFIFPKDNGAHPSFRTEWWYFTGNLTTKEGRRFGYQFTIFRNAISPKVTDSLSAWKSNQVYMGHFALTDIDNDKFYYFERFSRDGNRLAGAELSPLKIWLEDWSLEETAEGKYEFPDVNIKVKTKEVNLELELSLSKPVILQGQNGLSRKSKERGNASYYYSATKIITIGRIIVGGKEYSAEGYSWLDREWSTSALADYQKGWDWFSLQLDNNTELMYYRMRNKDGSIDEMSNGSVISETGRKENIRIEEIVLKETGGWKNPEGKSYPSGWIFSMPSKNTELRITPAVKNQELAVSIKYWEGSVYIEGIYEGKPVKGRGYTELTGYAD